MSDLSGVWESDSKEMIALWDGKDRGWLCLIMLKAQSDGSDYPTISQNSGWTKREITSLSGFGSGWKHVPNYCDLPGLSYLCAECDTLFSDYSTHYLCGECR